MNGELQRLLQRAKERHNNASGRRLAEIAQSAGHEIDRTQINRLLAGTYPHRPTRATAEAVAYLAGVDGTAVGSLLGMPPVYEPFVDELPDDVDVLDFGQRRAVLGVIRQMISDQNAIAMMGSSDTQEILSKYDMLGKDIDLIEAEGRHLEAVPEAAMEDLPAERSEERSAPGESEEPDA